jgi:hypothetical protein
MASRSLSDDDHVVRHLSPSQFDTDASGALLVFPQAFELRTGESYLSTSWLEFFAAPFSDRICATASAISRTRIVKASHAFAVGQVGSIKEACARFGQKIRILHEGNTDNPAYAAVRQYRSEEIELLDLLARDAWANVVQVQPFLDRVGPWNKQR